MASKIRHSLRNNINDSELMMSRGLEETAIKILRKTYNLSIKYQCHIETIIIADLLQKYVGLRNSQRVYELYAKSKVNHLQKSSKRFYAYDLFYKVMKSDDKLGIDNKSQYLKELKALEKEFEDDEIKSLSLRAQAYHCHYEGRYNESLNYAKLYLNLANTSASIRSIHNRAGANMQVAIVYVGLRDYKSAESFIKNSLSLFKKNSGNELRALEVLYLCFFKQKKYSEALKVSHAASESKAIRSSSLMKGAWMYRSLLSSYYMNNLEDLEKIDILGIENLLRGSRLRYQVRVLDLVYLCTYKKYEVLEYRCDAFYKILIGDGKQLNNQYIKFIKFIKIIIKYIDIQPKRVMKFYNENILSLDNSVEPNGILSLKEISSSLLSRIITKPKST